MWKLIFLVIIVWLAITIFKRMQAQSPVARQNDVAADEPSRSNVENMVQCDTCQVHLPRSEAFLVEGKFYCSQAHIAR